MKKLTPEDEDTLLNIFDKWVLPRVSLDEVLSRFSKDEVLSSYDTNDRLNGLKPEDIEAYLEKQKKNQ